MAARLSLLCHGATASTRAGAFPLDEPLEARALEETRRLAGRLARFDRIVRSPAGRAAETASALGLDAAIDDRLRDQAFGRWAGRRLADLARQEPEAMAEWLAHPGAAPHGGESLGDLMARVGGWMEEAAATPGRCLAITHAAVVRAAVLRALGAPAEAFWRIDVPPLGLVELSHDGRRWALRLGPAA